jgi:lipoyl synthase
VHCDILTIGQYLRPSRDHLPMARLYTPREFAELKTEALKMGFRHVESGPLVRSSYHAHEQAASTGLSVNILFWKERGERWQSQSWPEFRRSKNSTPT